MPNLTSFTQALCTMENVGTPMESDNDRDRVVRHLEAKGGVQLQQRLAPRAFVRGRYEDEEGNVKLRLGRLINSGTYLRLTLTIGENNVLDVFVDQLYPYGMQRNEEVVAKYGGLVRKTLVDKDSLCWTWMGFGYSTRERTYCDVSEHIMPRSVGYGYHSSECPKTTNGTWHWCPEGPTCGKIAWALNLSVFESPGGEEIGRQQYSLELRYVLFNKNAETGEEEVRIRVMLDGEHKGWLKSVDKEDAGLGSYDRDLLKLSSETFVKSKRNRARNTLPPQQEPYLTQIYKSPARFTGAPRGPGRQDELQTKMRCLLQLLNNSESFNLSLFVQVLFDQRCADAPTLEFVECLQTLVNGSNGKLQELLSQLRLLPRDFVPYGSLPSVPHILPILISFLMKLEVAATHGKNEASVRKWPRTLFEMMTTWTPEGDCNVCGYRPPTAAEHHHQFLRHFSPILVTGNGSEEPMNVREALKKWISDTRRKLATCKKTFRCKYDDLLPCPQSKYPNINCISQEPSSGCEPKHLREGEGVELATDSPHCH